MLKDIPFDISTLQDMINLSRLNADIAPGLIFKDTINITGQIPLGHGLFTPVPKTCGDIAASGVS